MMFNFLDLSFYVSINKFFPFRHIVSVPLKHMRTKDDLYKAFYEEKINRAIVPINQRLYVLEDIDCAGLDDIMKERSKATPVEDEIPTQEMPFESIPYGTMQGKKVS